MSGMTMFNYVTSLTLRIRWDILDFIIMQLGSKGDAICKESSISENEFYVAHINLICNHDVSHFRQVVTQLSKPIYPYIIITYYILFHRKNLEIAYTLYQMISDTAQRDPRVLNESEETACKMLEEIMETFKALSGFNNERDILPSHMKVLVEKLRNIKCIEHEWSCLFKDLLLSHLDVYNSKEKIKNVLSSLEAHEMIEPLSTEIIEHYNILDPGWERPIYKFFQGILHKLLKKEEEIETKINELEEEKRSYEHKLNKLNKIETIFSVLGEKINKIMRLIIKLFTWYFARRWQQKIKEIDSEIKKLRFKDLEEIIWHSK